MKAPAMHGYSGAAVATIILVLALAVTACSGLGGGTDTTVAASTTAAPTTTDVSAATTTTGGSPTTSVDATTTTGPPASTVTTEELASSEEMMASGNIAATCRIVGAVEYGARRIDVDYIDFLTGDAATQAAIAAGDLDPGEDLPNDYYISNTNPTIRHFEVSGSVVITTTSRGGGPDEPATWAEFMTWFSPTPPPGAEHLSGMPWRIEREAGTGLIVRIDEIYIP